MPNRILKSACAAVIAALLALPACSQTEEGVDLTQLFARQTEALADTPDLEAFSGAAAAAPQIPGLVAYADQKPREVGDIETFSTFNVVRNAHENIKARLTKIGKYCLVYVEQGRNVNSQTVARIAAAFDSKIYSECRSMFGNERSPGIDGEAKITLLLLDIRDFYSPRTRESKVLPPVISMPATAMAAASFRTATSAKCFISIFTPVTRPLINF